MSEKRETETANQNRNKKREISFCGLTKIKIYLIRQKNNWSKSKKNTDTELDLA